MDHHKLKQYLKLRYSQYLGKTESDNLDREIEIDARYIGMHYQRHILVLRLVIAVLITIIVMSLMHSCDIKPTDFKETLTTTNEVSK